MTRCAVDWVAARHRVGQNGFDGWLNVVLVLGRSRRCRIFIKSFSFRLVGKQSSQVVEITYTIRQWTCRKVFCCKGLNVKHARIAISSLATPCNRYSTCKSFPRKLLTLPRIERESPFSHSPSSESENRKRKVPRVHFINKSSAVFFWMNPTIEPSPHGPRKCSRVSFIVA